MFTQQLYRVIIDLKFTENNLTSKRKRDYEFNQIIKVLTGCF